MAGCNLPDQDLSRRSRTLAQEIAISRSEVVRHLRAAVRAISAYRFSPEHQGNELSLIVTPKSNEK